MTELDVTGKEERQFKVKRAKDFSGSDAKLMELIIQFLPIYDKSAKEFHNKRRNGYSLQKSNYEPQIIYGEKLQ